MKKLLLVALVLLTHLAFGQYSGTPLMLSLPMDQDTIEEDEPVFVWQTTLSNVQNDPRLNVQLSVVKMEEDQTQTEAMVENAPVFIRQNLLSSSLNYSSVDHELEEGVWYAWQVVLFYNGVQVQQSEVWKFIKTAPVEEKHSYYTLKTKADNSIIEFVSDELYYTTTEYGDFQLEGVISGKDIDNETVHFEELLLSEENTTGKSNQGREARYFKCDLSELNLKKGTYRIDWVANNQRHFISLVKKI